MCLQNVGAIHGGLRLEINVWVCLFSYFAFGEISLPKPDGACVRVNGIVLERATPKTYISLLKCLKEALIIFKLKLGLHNLK